MGKLKTHEKFIKEIADRFNGNISVLDKYIDQKTKIRFYCSICNNEWSTTPMSIFHTHIGCPACANKIISQKLITKNIDTTGKFIDLYPELAKRIDYDKNTDIHIENLSAHSGKFIWWKCEKCGREWQAKISKRANGENCPYCYRFEKSNLQQKVQNYIETNYCYDILHEHDCTLKCRNPKTNRLLPYDNELVIDNNTRLIIECNGEQHYKICGLTKLAAKKENTTPEEALKYVQWKDSYKKEHAITQGYHYLDIPYFTECDETYKTLIDNKIKEILSTIQN